MHQNNILLLELLPVRSFKNKQIRVSLSKMGESGVKSEMSFKWLLM